MSASTKELPSMADRLAKKTAEREAIAVTRRDRAEQLKDQGNKLFREARWNEAILCYELAIATYGPRAAYLNNLAAAYLKVERYWEAECAATMALQRDPRLVKARYRQALGSKGQGSYARAVCQFGYALKLDPNSKEIQAELADTERLLRERRQAEDYGSDEEEEWVDSDDCPGTKTPYLSDSESEDYKHVGNGTPCRYYNHNGCTRGAECAFKHAPDFRSIRDDLGRNVCIFYMLGLCKFSDDQCVYAHEKTYLPPAPRTWGNPKWIEESRWLATFLGAHKSAIKLEEMAIIMKGPMTNEGYIPNGGVGAYSLLSALMEENSYSDDFLSELSRGIPGSSTSVRNTQSSKAKKNKNKINGKSKGKGKGKAKGKKKGKAAPGFDSDSEDVEELDLQRMANGGFTDAEVWELRCQGISPWDDDAAAAMQILNGDF